MGRGGNSNKYCYHENYHGNIFKPGTALVHVWFLEIIQEVGMRVCTCVCVCPPGYEKPFTYVKRSLNN